MSRNGWNRTYPYFKAQIYNKSLLSWGDVKNSFSSIEDAREYISRKVKEDSQTRIIIVEGERSRRVLNDNELND